MSKSPFQSNPAFEKLGEDAKQAVSQAFDAMESWRGQVTELGEKNSDAMFDKMAEAAKSLGWPTDYVEMSRKQVQQVSKMQGQVMDQVMETWAKNMQAIGSGAQIPTFPNLVSIPGFPQFPQGGAGSPFPGMPGMPDMGAGAMNPMQMWMQAAEMWQKSWQQAMSAWTDAQSSAMQQKPPTQPSKFTANR